MCKAYVYQWAESDTMNDRSGYVRLCWTEEPEKQTTLHCRHNHFGEGGAGIR